MASKEGRLRALNTCAAHLCAMVADYIPTAGVSLAHRFGQQVPPLLHTLTAHIYLLVPLW